MHEQLAAGTDDGARRKQFVLVVDSDPRDASATGMLLQNFGYSVSTVASAEEALELITVAVPALVVMELTLPGMSGFDLLARVRQDARLTKVPVIVQTAVPDIRTDDRCREEGCTLYLRKPVPMEDLYRAVQSTLERTPRRNLRAATYLRASVDGQAMGPELITVISDSGMFIKTLKPRPVGTEHAVTFVVSKRVITVKAAVLYVYAFGEGPHKEPGMGMKFLSIDGQDKAFLRKFIESQISPPVPPSA